MSFLAPLFLAGLAALAVPVLIHLMQRERRQVVAFPSLMFLQRIPYRSVRRRRIRHWTLLLLRAAALASIVAAFGRPFLPRAGVAASGDGGPREVVLLLDRSYSMGYAGRWDRARAAARQAIERLGPADRASIVLFAGDAEVALRSTADRPRLLAAIDEVEPGSGATRYAPALKAAGAILAESSLPRREAILVTDFQRGGWQPADGVRLPEGSALVTVPVAGGQEPANVAVTPVSVQRSMFANQERITIGAGVINRSSRRVSDVQATLEIGGRAIQTQRVTVEAHGSASIAFAPFTLVSPGTRGTVRLGPDALAADNAFHFVVSPAEPLRIAILERPGAPGGASLYLARALSIGDAPPFDVKISDAESWSGEEAGRAAAVVVNDVPVPTGLAARLAAVVERGGGLLVLLGERAAWPPEAAGILPARPTSWVDRSRSAAARLGGIEYGHPAFELFRAPRSGDFSAARFYGYRALAPEPGTIVLARFDDGRPALVERQVGRGRVLAWASTFDVTWSDLALKPVFLPFVHRIVRHLTRYADPVPWLTVGQMLASSAASPGHGTRGTARLALSPSGRRLPIDGEEGDVLVLAEQGFYEVRALGDDSTAPLVVASNVDLAESDLTMVDPEEVRAAVAGRAGDRGAAAPAAPPSAGEQERAQRVWWYLILAGIVLLGGETLLSNRLSSP